jgi:hypothetical protein
VIVRYEVTVEDMMAVMLRAARKRRPRLGWHWRQSVILGAIAALFAAAAASESKGSFAAWAVALFIAFVAILTFLLNMRATATLKGIVKAQMGSRASFPCEIEIAPESLTSRQLGEEVKREWRTVKSINEVSGGIEFDLPYGGVLFVPDRAFMSPAEQSEFLRMASEFSVRG